MKACLALAVALLLGPATIRAQGGKPLAPDPPGALNENTQFIFLSVLEGLYEDGVASEDVDQILRRAEGHSPAHFVYSCPVCTPVVWALEAYRARPGQFTGAKRRGSTLGIGLPEDVSAALRSEDVRARLGAINNLVKGWIERRMRLTRLTETERAKCTASLESMRRQGMEALERFRREGLVSEYAPAYADIDECAVCNGAVGKPMKLPDKAE